MPSLNSNSPQNDGGGHQALAALRLASQWMATGRKLQRGLAAAVAPLDLGESELLVLLAIHDAQCAEPDGPAIPLDQKQLAGELGMSPALVSQLVEQMRRRDWVASARHPSDRRRQIWHLTPAGNDLLNRALDHLAPWAMQLQQAALAERAALDRLAELAHRIVCEPRDAAVPPIVSARGDAA